MVTNSFNPLEYGATPVDTGDTGGFNPLEYGAIPVQPEETQSSVGFFARQPSGPSPYETGNFLTSPVISYTPQEGTGIGGAVLQGLRTVGKGALNLPTSATRFATNILNPMTYVGLGKTIAGGLQSAPIIRDLYNKATASNPAGQERLQSNREAFQGFVEGLKSQYGSLENIQRSLTEDPIGTLLVARGITEGVGRLATKVGIPGGRALTRFGQNVAPVEQIPQASKELYNAITAKSPEQIDQFITKNYNKGIKPSVSGKSSFGQASKYNQNTIGAVKTIVENKPNLNILNENGEVTGKLPTNIKEFAQAIDQTKEQIFKQYDTLQKKAGELGAKVDLKPIASELSKVSSDPVIQDTHPEIARYADERSQALNARRAYSTDQTQQAIKLYNKSLEAFYRNPTYDTATRASIDSMIVNKMREGLDASIETANTRLVGDPSYQGLKNKYGQLKTIEKDVIHRAIVEGRKVPKGLLDFTDILSGAELARALITMNPADFASSFAIKGIARYYKYLNDPNTAISRLFSGVEKATKGQTNLSPLNTSTKKSPMLPQLK